MPITYIEGEGVRDHHGRGYVLVAISIEQAIAVKRGNKAHRKTGEEHVASYYCIIGSYSSSGRHRNAGIDGV